MAKHPTKRKPRRLTTNTLENRSQKASRILPFGVRSTRGLGRKRR